MFFRHTPLLEVNQAKISLDVLDTWKSKLWDSEIKDKTKYLCPLTFKCEIILMLVTSSRKIYNSNLQSKTRQNIFVYPTFKCEIFFDVSDI